MNKQSVNIDENQPFPQFSLNVSNPISWKLMLLIMLMQLLTNMMLVVLLFKIIKMENHFKNIRMITLNLQFVKKFKI